MGWGRLKWAFFVSVAIWLVGGGITLIAINRSSGNIVTLLNLHSIFVTGFGTLAIVLGAILVGRWVWAKSTHLLANRKEQLFSRAPVTIRGKKGSRLKNVEAKIDNVTDRWKALLRFDEEIRAAAEKLRPFGDSWVNELGQAYFALNEDRKYLPSIVSRLVEEAKRDKAQRWADCFRQTADGELCTEESLDILRKAEALDYALDVERNGTFTVTKSTSTHYLRSNYDIQKFGEGL